MADVDEFPEPDTNGLDAKKYIAVRSTNIPASSEETRTCPDQRSFGVALASSARLVLPETQR